MRSISRFLTAALCFVLFAPTARADVTIIDNGQSKAAIFVPARVLEDTAPELAGIWGTLKPEELRRRLRESVKDMAGVLERISGAKVEIVAGPPAAGEKRLPILIGELAVEKFGKPQKEYPYQQGLRIVVQPGAIGLAGESDLGTSYAVYTLLEQLGCRWYIPSALGECLPSTKTVAFKEQDLSTGPSTIFRGQWYCDNDFGRRNRLGGMLLNAGHALESWVPNELRKEHPEIRAIIKGQQNERLVKWTHPLVAEAISNAILASLEKDPTQLSFSLSPDDGATWDESDDAKYDAGDFDAAAQAVAKADRLMVLANRVAEKVTAKYPNVKFGLLAYADYIRPPVREKIHPAVVPEIAPITFSRAHPMNDPGEPNNEGVRYLVEGWGKLVPATSYYFYAFNLAEVASPNPMLTKWGHDIPYIYDKGRCKYWQPETLSNFETCMHALCLGNRMAWDHTQKPQAIVDELHEKFYGHAAKPMAAYWQHIDDIWVKTREFSGCGFGHLRRFTPQKLARAAELLGEAKAAARTDLEKARVELAAASFAQWDNFMKLRHDQAEGRFAKLKEDSDKWDANSIALGIKYEPQYCFTKMGWTGERNLAVRYFDAFYKLTYDDAARIANNFEILTQPPLRTWKYQQDKDKQGEAQGWMKPDFKDGDWKSTDVAVETWSTLGYHNYMGSLWYRTTIKLPAIPPGKKVYLWIGSTDGRVKPYINGKPALYTNDKGETADSFSGYCQPASFDITPLVASGADNQISLFCTREFLNELGTGGLLAPPVVYRDK